MDLKEYKDKYDLLTNEFLKNKRDLQQSYIESIVEFKVGDIIKNITGIIKVEKIQFQTLNTDIPYIEYYGTRLKRINGQLFYVKGKLKGTLSTYFSLESIQTITE